MIRLILVIAGCILFSGTDLLAKEPPTRLVYEVDVKKGGKVDPAAVVRLVATIEHRVKPDTMFSFFSIVKVRQINERQIEILVPADKPKLAARIERIVDRMGTIEFRVLANPDDHEDLIEQAESKKDDIIKNEKGEVLAFWMPVARGHEKGLLNSISVISREKKINGKDVHEVLVIKDDYNITGAYLQEASQKEDVQKKPCIHICLNETGGKLMGKFTENNRPTGEIYRQMGIILDGKLYSAPRIMTRIHDNFQITGNFTNKEVHDLVEVLNLGSLPLPIKKVEEDKK